VPLAALFGCTFIINLPDRKDRRRAILAEIEKIGMPLAPGVVELFPGIRPSQAAGFPSRGVRGCFLSHLGILKEARCRGLDSVLILEDDLVISPAVGDYFESLRAALVQQPWYFLYFGHREEVPSPVPPVLVPFDGPIVTAHFYAVREPAISGLVDYLEEVQLRRPGDPAGGPMHVDGALSMFRQRNPELATRIAAPNLGWQRPSRSDIHSTWLQSAPLFRHAYDAARVVRSALGKKC
jgi:hypothetical protein